MECICNNIIDNVGDSVLVPTPYYPAFDHDFWDLGDVYTEEINVDRRHRNHPFDDEANSLFDAEAYDNAYNSAIGKGRPPKALLLTNPSNPLGVIFSKSAMLAAIAWARKKSLHIIVDEIYSLSVYGEEMSTTSVISMLGNQLSDDVHILWSLSKDFGGSGLRLGVLYSQSKSLIRCMNSCNDSFMVSNLMQEMTMHLLSNDQWLNNYFHQNRLSLRQSYTLLKSTLEDLGLVCVSAGAAIFAFADFSSILKEKSFECESELHLSLANEFGVLFTPGQACHCQYPGYFRICYAWVPYATLVEGMRRLREFVHAYANKN